MLRGARERKYRKIKENREISLIIKSCYVIINIQLFFFVFFSHLFNLFLILFILPLYKVCTTKCSYNRKTDSTDYLYYVIHFVTPFNRLLKR